MIRVVLADDHAIVRAGLRALLTGESDVSIVAEAVDGASALDAVRKHAPDVLLLDLSLPPPNGVDVTRTLRAEKSATRVLVLTMHAAPEFVRPALDAGAMGYVVKGAGLDDLVVALRAVARGERFVDAMAAAAMRAPPSADDALDQLTPREVEVLRRVASGETNREMAQALGLSPKTVDSHRTNLMRKLDVHDAQGLTRLAVRRGLVR